MPTDPQYRLDLLQCEIVQFISELVWGWPRVCSYNPVRVSAQKVMVREEGAVSFPVVTRFPQPCI